MTHCSTPAHTSIRRWLRSFTSCTLAGRFVAELRSRFCSQLAFRSWLLAVWRPQIWRDEWMLLRMTSLQTLQTKIALQDWERPVSLNTCWGLWPAVWAGSQLQRSHTFLNCVCILAWHCHAFSRYSHVFRSFYWVMCQVLLCPALTLYPKIQPVACMNHVL